MSFTIKKNDRAPSISATFTSGGSPVDLSGATVKFLMAPSVGGTPKVNASATIVSATEGQVRYDWASGNTDTVGLFYAEWEVTYSNGVKQTFPNDNYLHIVVMSELG